MYRLIRPLLFLFDPEKIHHLVFMVLQVKGKLPGFRKLLKILFTRENPGLTRTFCGIQFKNPVGLAAGFDKNGILIDEMACFGFGFIEIGTLTPRPQPGNDKPRLFRLPVDHALINRMGFNNDGVVKAVERLKKKSSTVIIGGNIGKNKDTPNEKALDDYAECLDHLYPYVDYFVINVSSPNTPGLRELQEKEPLRKLLLFITRRIATKIAKKPVLLKIAPDLESEQLDDIAEIVKEVGIDGIIATNTTITRTGLKTPGNRIAGIGQGGLSGRPLKARAEWVTRYLREKLGEKFLIIGSGGIMTPQDAIDRMDAGANLIQIYTGFVYEGPSFIKRINQALMNQKTR